MAKDQGVEDHQESMGTEWQDQEERIQALWEARESCLVFKYYTISFTADVEADFRTVNLIATIILRM